MNYNVDEKGYYGDFGGAFIPEMLYPNVAELRENYLKITAETSFKKEFDELLKVYVGRPTPLYFAKRLSERYNTKIYLKREDLSHWCAQGKQYYWPDIIGQTLWKKPHHCRNWCWSTRCGNSHSLCAYGNRMHRVYGRARYTTSSTQRCAYENAWS